jgi:hypothetical protein
MSNHGESWNGKLTVPKPFALRTSASQPPKPHITKPATNPATADNNWKPKLTQPVPFKLSQGGGSIPQPKITQSSALPRSNYSSISVPNRKEFSATENTVPWNKNTVQAQSSGASGLSWNLGNTKKPTEFQEFSRFTETRPKLQPDEIAERLQNNANFDLPRSTHLTIPMSPNLRTNKKVIQRPIEPQRQEKHVAANNYSRPPQLTVPMSPHLRTNKKVQTNQPQKQEEFVVVDNQPKQQFHLTVPMSPHLRTNNKKMQKQEVYKHVESFSTLSLKEPTPVETLAQPSLKRKFDDETFISFKSPLKKSEKKVLGLKKAEPLTKSLLKKKSAKQLQEYEKFKEQPFEVNEEDFEDHSASHLNYDLQLSDNFNLHSMEEDDEFSEEEKEEYSIMNHILNKADTTPKMKKIKLVNTNKQSDQVNLKNENEPNLIAKSATKVAQPKQQLFQQLQYQPEQHPFPHQYPQQQHQQQQQQHQPHVIVTKRPLTVPQSPKLFTKRLR